MNPMKEAFDAVKADEALKAQTLCLVRQRLRAKPVKTKRPALRLAVALGSFALVCLLAVSGYTIYFQEAAYLSVDVNPSIGLSINRFDRVVRSEAFNKDGQEVLSQVSLFNQPYQAALELIMSAEADGGYFNETAEVAITVQSENSEKGDAILEQAKSSAESYCSAERLHCSQVGGELHAEAQAIGLSPGKYKAILELMALDPQATVEQWRDRPMREIQEAIHSRKSGSGVDGGEISAPDSADHGQQQNGSENGNASGGPPRDGTGHQYGKDGSSSGHQGGKHGKTS